MSNVAQSSEFLMECVYCICPCAHILYTPKRLVTMIGSQFSFVNVQTYMPYECILVCENTRYLTCVCVCVLLSSHF